MNETTRTCLVLTEVFEDVGLLVGGIAATLDPRTLTTIVRRLERIRAKAFRGIRPQSGECLTAANPTPLPAPVEEFLRRNRSQSMESNSNVE